MHRIPLVLALVATLAGCATASPTYLKDGKQGLSIDCSGQAMSWEKCYEKAQASCPSGNYDIIGTDGKPAPKPDASLLDADIGSFQNRTLTIQCK
ncbi:hypothetical protein SFA35_17450 [Pseudomonas sp. HR96]|uniref:hypothetical protein n=1 Tax=Pseudomonas sp. HR96 TaxID=1027966 RepID=UPI002A7512A2|nr:hypothetical protein [Pseudomonas sp. HR96]WPO98416.1 hypothetical protein SFA35_17450 [Pseudomonas sp. HR96]